MVRVEVAMRFCSPLALLTLTACNKASEDTTPAIEDTYVELVFDNDNDDDGNNAGNRDRDEDGFVASEDCDDLDASIYPGAPDVCDGIDQDCSGDDAPGTVRWLPLAGEPVDLSSVWATGTAKQPVVWTAEEAGLLHLCEGTWDVALSIRASNVQLEGSGAPGDVVVKAESTACTLDVRNGASVLIDSVELQGGSTACPQVANISGNATLRDSSFTQQSAPPGTPAILLEDDARLTLDNLRLADVMTGLGQAPDAVPTVTITDVTFQRLQGRPFVLGPAQVTIEDSTFTEVGLPAQLSGKGSQFTLTDVSVRGSGTPSTPSAGIFEIDKAEVQFVNLSIEQNRMAGPVIACDGGTLLVDQPDITTVQSTADGAILNGQDCAVNWVDGEVRNVQTTGKGAVLRLTEGALLCDKCVFHDNLASSCGGASLTDVSPALFDDGAIYNNIAADSGSGNEGLGGGLCVAGSVELSGLEVTGNQAVRGGGFYLEGTAAAPAHELADVFIANNAASAEGGGIYAVGTALTVTGGDITNNSAGTDGGAIWATGLDETLNLVVTDNNAGGLGGGFYVGCGIAPQLGQTLFQRNEASSGGAIAYECLTAAYNSNFGNGADDNVPNDIVWTGNSSTYSYGNVNSVICNSSGCTEN